MNERIVKTFILDTSTLIEDPDFMLSLQENIVVIPEVVLEELDRLKDKKGEKGWAARHALRLLDDLILNAKDEDLATGIRTPEGGKIIVELNHIQEKLPSAWITDKADNRILQVCLGYLEENHRRGKKNPVILVSEDAGLRVKANSLKIPFESIKKRRAPALDQQYTGKLIHKVDPEWIHFLHRNRELDPNMIGLKVEDLVLNQFIVLTDQYDPKRTYVGIWKGKSVEPIENLGNYYPAGIKPKNLMQQLMIHMCLAPVKEAPCVIIKGPAGTAKTLLAVASGYHQTKNYAGYKKDEVGFRKLLICRPAISDEDLGYLPGTEQEKLAPYIRPIRDNLEIILMANAKQKEVEELRKEMVLREEIDKLFETGIIDYQAVGFLRGRSITDTYILIDEAQNLTGSQVEMILTRVGEGSKIVLTGDPNQIDHPYLDERSNGLSIASEIMKNDPLCMQITLSELDSVRSALARSAATRFNSLR